MPTITITETLSTARLTTISTAIEAAFPRITAEVIVGGDSGAVQLAKTEAFWKRWNRFNTKEAVDAYNMDVAQNAVVPTDDTIFSP